MQKKTQNTFMYLYNIPNSKIEKYFRFLYIRPIAGNIIRHNLLSLMAIRVFDFYM